MRYFAFLWSAVAHATAFAFSQDVGGVETHWLPLALAREKAAESLEGLPHSTVPQILARPKIPLIAANPFPGTAVERG
jgi:hypothetical protein